MADLLDVENALVAFIATALYPTFGTSPVPAGTPSIAGPQCKVKRGWPVPGSLDADLAAGIVNITVYTESGGEKNTTRYPKDWQTMTAATPQVILSVVGNVVTVSGSIQVGDFACIKVGLRNVYSVPVGVGSTLASVASALASLVSANYPGTVVVGPVLTIPTSAQVLVATGGQGVAWQELERQQQIFQVTLWCPTPVARDQVGPVLKVAFAKIERLTLADNSYARVYYQRSIISDGNQVKQSYRRDMLYTAEFPTSNTQSFPSIGAFVASTTGGISPADSPAFPSVV